MGRRLPAGTMNTFPDDAPLPLETGQHIAAAFSALYAEHPRIVTTTERAVVGRSSL